MTLLIGRKDLKKLHTYTCDKLVNNIIKGGAFDSGAASHF